MLISKKFLIIFSISLLGLVPVGSSAATLSLKVGFVTDWEYGEQSQVGHKLPDKGKIYLQSAVNYYNKTYKPDVVVGGGDYISSYDVNKKKARSQLSSILNIFQKVKAHRLYLIGNHDVRKLTKNDVKKSLKINYSRTYYDINGFRLVLLDTNHTNSKGKYNTIGSLTADDLAWLDATLTTSLPVVVFSHHSPIHTPDGDTTRTNMSGAGEVRAVLERHDNIVAVFSGHHPINYHEQREGIDYIIINNLSAKASAKSFSTIDLSITGNQATAVVNQYGKKPAFYHITKSIN